MKPDDKVMFSIYREAAGNRRWCVVYFTELGEHDREGEINKALAGDHLFDGFLDSRRMGEARGVMNDLLSTLNGGAALSPADARAKVAPYLAE